MLRGWMVVPVQAGSEKRREEEWKRKVVVGLE
jgi:hypothetical protein